MIRLQYQVELAYEIRSPAGADFIFNVHAAQTAHAAEPNMVVVG